MEIEAVPSRKGNVRRAFWWLFVNKREEIPFIVFWNFLFTFLVTRTYVYLTNHDIVSLIIPEYVVLNAVHVHHFFWGIIILAAVGFWALYDIRPVAHRRLAVIYGIGLGLTFDEFALWLRLKDDYGARLSYDAVITISLVFLNVIYFPGFWKRMGSSITRVIRAVKRRMLG